MLVKQELLNGLRDPQGHAGCPNSWSVAQHSLHHPKLEQGDAQGDAGFPGPPVQADGVIRAGQEGAQREDNPNQNCRKRRSLSCL